MTDYQKQSPMQAIEVNNIKNLTKTNMLSDNRTLKKAFHFRYLKVNCSVS